MRSSVTEGAHGGEQRAPPPRAGPPPPGRGGGGGGGGGRPHGGEQRPLHRCAVPLPRCTGEDEGRGSAHAAPPMCVIPPI
jgi:hypothetical protein